MFIIFAIFCFACAVFFGYKAYDVKTYIYADRFKYVGGDAYNLIIIANYFTAYIVSCVVSAVGGIISIVTCGIINAINKIDAQ